MLDQRDLGDDNSPLAGRKAYQQSKRTNKIENCKIKIEREKSWKLMRNETKREKQKRKKMKIGK